MLATWKRCQTHQMRLLPKLVWGYIWQKVYFKSFCFEHTSFLGNKHEQTILYLLSVGCFLNLYKFQSSLCWNPQGRLCLYWTVYDYLIAMKVNEMETVKGRYYLILRDIHICFVAEAQWKDWNHFNICRESSFSFVR